jgi:hypothetical protein
MVVLWYGLVAAFVGSAIGAVCSWLWYRADGGNEAYYAALAATAVAVLSAIGVAVQFFFSTDKRKQQSERLAAYLIEAQQLRGQLQKIPLPIAEHNEWVDRVNKYLRENLGSSYEARFSDFSGMVFYGDGSERSQVSRSIDGRSRNLHEFMSELTR